MGGSGRVYITNMSDEPETKDVPAEPEVAPPPRPQMSDVTPAPVPPRIVPAGPVKVASSLWIASFVAGLMAILVVFLGRDDQLSRLGALLTDMRPNEDAATIDAVAEIVLWGSLIALAFVIVVEGILLAVMMRRHGAVRWVQLPVILVQCVVSVLADALVVTPGVDGWAVHLLLLLQLVLAGAALVVSTLPGAGRWFRAGRERRRHPA